MGELNTEFMNPDIVNLEEEKCLGLFGKTPSPVKNECEQTGC